ISRLVPARTTWICSPMAPGCGVRVFQSDVGRGSLRINEHGDANRCGQHFMQKSEAFRYQLIGDEINACPAAGWSGDGRDESKVARVNADEKNDGDFRGGCFDGQRRSFCHREYDSSLLAPNSAASAGMRSN